MVRSSGGFLCTSPILYKCVLFVCCCVYIIICLCDFVCRLPLPHMLHTSLETGYQIDQPREHKQEAGSKKREGRHICVRLMTAPNLSCVSTCTDMHVHVCALCVSDPCRFSFVFAVCFLHVSVFDALGVMLLMVLLNSPWELRCGPVRNGLATRTTDTTTTTATATII